MFTLIKNIIAYSGTSTNTNTYDSAVFYACCVIIILGTIVTIDLLYKFFLRFLPRESK